jgi:hypothetical protein
VRFFFAFIRVDSRFLGLRFAPIPRLRDYIVFSASDFAQFVPFSYVGQVAPPLGYAIVCRSYLRKSALICGLSRRRLGEGGFVCLRVYSHKRVTVSSIGTANPYSEYGQRKI